MKKRCTLVDVKTSVNYVTGNSRIFTIIPCSPWGPISPWDPGYPGTPLSPWGPDGPG